MTTSGPDAGVRLGSIFFGSFLYGTNLMLFGRYLRSPARVKDTMVVQGTVALLFFLVSAQIVSLWGGMYIWMIINRSPRIIFNSSTLVITALTNYLAAFVVQIFLTSRTWILCRGNWFFVAPILLCTLAQLVAGIAQVELIIAHRNDTPNIDFFYISVTQTSIHDVAMATADILITITLCRFLNGSRSGIKRTDSVIDKLVKYAIHRAAATSLAALVDVALFNSMAVPAFLIPFVAIGQLSVISMVSMLLNREALQGMLHNPSPISFSLHTISLTPMPPQTRSRSPSV